MKIDRLNNCFLYLSDSPEENCKIHLPRGIYSRMCKIGSTATSKSTSAGDLYNFIISDFPTKDFPSTVFTESIADKWELSILLLISELLPRRGSAGSSSLFSQFVRDKKTCSLFYMFSIGNYEALNIVPNRVLGNLEH